MHDSSGQISDDSAGRSRHSLGFSDTWFGKILLTVVVFGLTGALVAYSVMASFHAPPTVRRIQSSDRDNSIALSGRVLCTNQPDAGAVVVAWPDSLPTPKYHLTADEAFESRIPGDQTHLSLSRADNEGRYTLHREQPVQGRGTSSYFFVLAISNGLHRKSPPRDDDLQRLTTYFSEPLKLLGDREYELQLVLLEANVSTEQSFLLSGSDAQSDTTATDN